MAVLRMSRPLWIDRARTTGASRFPRLRGAVDADVAIVGAGMTGASSAWRFSSAGARVVVVEAGRVAGGSTSASTALLMQEPDEDFVRMRTRYGTASTRRIWDLSRLATAELVHTLRSLRIQCNLTPCDSVYYSENGDDSLRRELAERTAAGLACSWIDRPSLRRVAGIDAAGAIRTQGNAQADPYRAALGLIRSAVDRGARVFERTPALRIDREGRGVVVSAPRGRVRASWVVIATGYATPEFRPLLARFRMQHTYVLATPPLDPRQRRAIGLRRVMLWDTGRPYHYARWTADNRLLVGGADRPQTAGARRVRAFRDATAALRAHFERIYPALAGIETEYAWEGLFATTPDGLPYVGLHRRYPRHLFALGYGGNGMTLGYLASGLLLGVVNGTPSDDLALFEFSR